MNDPGNLRLVVQVVSQEDHMGALPDEPIGAPAVIVFERLTLGGSEGKHATYSHRQGTTGF